MMARRGHNLLGLGAALWLVSLGPVALAQAVRYDIPRQDLAAALVTLAIRSSRNIVFPATLVSGRRSAPVTGASTFSEAIRQLLAGSGLGAKIERDGSVVITGAAPRSTSPTPAGGPRPPAGGRGQAPSPGPEIVVKGRALAAFAALRAESSLTILTAGELEAEPDHNVVEALGHVAGVTVLDGGPIATNSVPVDLAARGEGNYIALRGLDAEFNVSMINGVDVVESQPYSRGVQLNLLPTSGLSQLLVTKSLTANMDADAIGGLLDFRTPSAFDFQAPTHGAFSLGGQIEDQALRYGLNPLGGSASLEGGARFGPAQTFGVYASAYYADEHFSNGVVDGVYPAQTNAMWAYGVQTASHASAPGLDPAANLVLTGLDAGLTTGETHRYGGALSLDWRPRPDLSAFARVNIATALTDQATYYAQIYGNNITSAEIGTSGLYAPLIANVQPRYYYETYPEAASLGTAQLGGAKQFGPLRLAPVLFVSWGENDDPNHFELSGREPEVGPGFAYGGDALFASRGEVPRPLLSATELGLLEDFSGYGARKSGELSQEFSHQLKQGAKLDAVYDLAPGISLTGGVKYEDAEHDHTYRDYTSQALYTTDANDPSLADLGILSGSVKSLVPGQFDYPAPLIDQAAALNLFRTHIQAEGGLANAIDGCDTIFINNYNCDTQRAEEGVAAAYVMGRFELGDFEMIPGFRYEHSRIANRFWVIPQSGAGVDLPGYFATNHTDYSEPLPSLQLNYRPAPLAVYRAGIWASYVPPALFQLGGSSQTVNTGGGAAEGGTTTITEGNPNLKPVQALNFDVSGDWATLRGEQASAALFYKALSHYIYDSVGATFTNLTSTQEGGTVISQPHNGGSGRVFGLELSGRKPLFASNALLSGLGVGGNLTWTQSTVNTQEAGLSSHERLLNQPDIETNVQLFYEKNALGLHLLYRYVGAYVTQYKTLGDTSALDTWVRPSERLDLSASYRTAPGVKLSLSVANLLDDPGYAATVGRKSWAIPSLVYSGRTVMVSAKYAY